MSKMDFRREFTMTALTLFVMIQAVSSIRAQVPGIMSYQGRLNDSTGDPVDDTVSIVFTLYDDSAAGSPGNIKWQESHDAVPVANGLFSVTLGAGTPPVPLTDDVFAEDVRYLGITVGNDPELRPRTRLTSCAYTFKALAADTARFAANAMDADRVDGLHASELLIPGMLFPSDDLAKIPLIRLYTGPGSGLDADLLDGQHATAFIAIDNDYGRFGVATDLYEGDSTLASRYVGQGQLGSVTSVMIADNSIVRSDVSSTFKAPYSDTADYARDVNLSFLDSRFVNEGQANSVFSPMIQNNSIAREDVISDFKAPYADTSDYARATAPDIDWQLSVTDGSDTTLFTGGGWGLARMGNTLHGSEDHTHVNLGVSNTTGSLGQNDQYCTVAGGFINTARSYAATISGGANNTGIGQFVNIGGGNHNSINGYCSTVGGGSYNDVNGFYSVIAGGEQNSVSGTRSIVAGGSNNKADENYAVVAGGGENEAAGPYATVSGGRFNSVRSYYSAIPGGYGDTTFGDYSVVAGYGVHLTSDADFTLAFGYDFTTSKPHAVIFWDSTSSEYPEIKVGIQHVNPTNIITVKRNSTTDPLADDWTIYPIPPEGYGMDSDQLTSPEYREILEKLVSVPMIGFGSPANGSRRRIGIPAAQAPQEIIAEGETDAISLKEYISMLHAALKAQQEQIAVLTSRLDRLEARR